ncbi:MAG: hypothetical protein KAY11_10015 [Ilumatobacteraceae bacterium]|uniref:JmjC domain-containing protein n=1 Tax=Candidatus Neomicrothrix sp. TaxID=2719034 RepID=UPI001B764DF3|nr:cupin domain-containing protein [Candidatus Microthrix sp.]MBP7995518.1 hypothetical protein [Candidatus Microthrix sp.]MBP8209890.1 hypothetical protein [Ilumatobacteraceae bacterium]
MTDVKGIEGIDAEPALLQVGAGFSRRVVDPTVDDPLEWRAAAAMANRRAVDFANRRLGLVLGEELARVLPPGDKPASPFAASVPVFFWNAVGMSARVLRLLEMQAPQTSDAGKLRVVRGGAFKEIDPPLYMRGQGAHGDYSNWRPDAAVLASLIDDGAVVNLNYLEDHDAVVRRLAELVARSSRSAVNVNAYLSRSGSSGTGPHWDDHDVILMQLVGTKRWRLGAPTADSPVKGMGLNDASGPLVLDTDLRAGGALYIPRGFWHEGTSDGDLSIHLTISINRPRAKTVAEYWLSGLDEEAEHRADLSSSGTLPDSLRFAADDGDLCSFWAGLAATQRCSTSNRVDLISNLLALESWTGLGLSARVPTPGGFAIRGDDVERAVLAFGGSEVTCSSDVAVAITTLASGACVRVDEFVDDHAERFDGHAVLRELLLASFLDVYLGDEPDWPLVEADEVS